MMSSGMYIPEIATHILTHPKLEDLKTQYHNIRYWEWRDYKNFLNSAAAPQCGGRRVAETGENVAKSVLKPRIISDVFQKYYYVKYLNSKSHDLLNLNLSGNRRKEGISTVQANPPWVTLPTVLAAFCILQYLVCTWFLRFLPKLTFFRSYGWIWNLVPIGRWIDGVQITSVFWLWSDRWDSEW